MRIRRLGDRAQSEGFTGSGEPGGGGSRKRKSGADEWRPAAETGRFAAEGVKNVGGKALAAPARASGDDGRTSVDDKDGDALEWSARRACDSDVEGRRRAIMPAREPS